MGWELSTSPPPSLSGATRIFIFILLYIPDLLSENALILIDYVNIKPNNNSMRAKTYH